MMELTLNPSLKKRGTGFECTPSLQKEKGLGDEFEKAHWKR